MNTPWPRMAAGWISTPVSQRARLEPYAAKIEVGPDIAADNQEGLRAEQRQRPNDAPGSFQRYRTLIAPADDDPERMPVPERGVQMLREPRGIDHDLADAGASQSLEVPHDEWPARDRQQRLGLREGERIKAGGVSRR